MPASYAHITLANFAKERPRLQALTGFPEEAILALNRYGAYCEFGSISPDYPYLALGNSEAKQWADVMHYEHTGEFILQGLHYLKGLQGEKQRKCFSWLMGCLSHIIADVTVHPIINVIVGGEYSPQTATEHRICEMNQDVTAYSKLKLDEIGMAKHLPNGIGQCHDSNTVEKIDPDIEEVWTIMLENTHSTLFNSNRPDFTAWHRGFRVVLENLVSSGYKMIPFARHLAADWGLTFPEKPEPRFISGLKGPAGEDLDYDRVFDYAIDNITGIWLHAARGLYEEDTKIDSLLGEWNLDTGRNSNKQLVYWRTGTAVENIA